MSAVHGHAQRLGHVLRSAIRRAAVLLLCVTAPAWSFDTASTVPASELRYILQGGLGFSDNRQRQSDNAEDDLFLAGVFGFTAEGATPRLAWRGSGQMQASQSLQGGRDEPPRAELALAVDWTLIDQRLAWHFAQLAAVEQVDPLLADTSDNRQQTRIFVTGPSLLFGTPSSWLTRFDGRMAIARADESPAFDHERQSLTASVQRHSTPVLRWTLLGEHADVAFRRNGAFSDFTRNDVLIRAERLLPRGLLEVNVGHTRIDRRRGGSVQRPLWHATLTLATPADGQLRLDYADALTDAGRDLSLLEDPAERLWQEGRRARVDGALYRLRSVDLGWREQGARLGWSFTPFFRQVDYIDADAVGEGRSYGLRGGVTYRLTPRWSLQADAAESRFGFVGVARDDRDRGLRLGAERHLASRWFLRLAASRFERDSSQPDASYDENMLTLFLLYRSDA